MFYVYFLKNSKGELYIGQTNNLKVRENQQLSKSQKAAKFIKDSNGTFELVYYEKYPTRLEAMRREKQLKGWTRAKKEALINKDFDLLKKL
jgi:putative endonuclease